MRFTISREKLQSLVGTMMSTVGEIQIDKLTVIDKELAANGSNFAVKAAITAEQLKQMLGVDVAAAVQRFAGDGKQSSPAAPPPRLRPPTQPGVKPPGTTMAGRPELALRWQFVPAWGWPTTLALRRIVG